MSADSPPLVADADQLLAWARSRAGGDRERLLLKLADLCASEDAASSEATAALLQDVLMALVGEAERDIRRRLAERLADAEWAPRPLVTVLALDDIDIARPLIAASPVLNDADLVRVLVEATIEHQIEVARRPRIGARVVEAVLVRSEPAVLSALAGNATAEVGGAAMARLVECSRRIAAMRGPLARHPAMTQALAERMYAWVGDTLRDALAARFSVDEVRLGAEVRAAVRDLQAAGVGETSSPVEEPSADREDMERRLIAKLAASGQLRPGYLLRTLREGKRSLFELGLSALSGIAPGDLRRAMTSDRPELLAYACVAVGMDKSVFPTVLAGVRQLNGGHPRSSAETRRMVDVAFQIRSAEAARLAFRAALEPELKTAV